MTQLGHNAFTGTMVKDYLEVSLFDDTVDLTDADSTGAAVTVDRPGHVAFVLELSTVTGTDPTLTCTVQASDTSDFSDDVVTVATLSTVGTNEDSKVYVQNAYVNKKYVRVVNNMTGTSPVYTGAELYVRPPHWHRTDDTTAALIV